MLNVTIKCKDFRKIISSYHTISTLFYLDPPYHNTKRSSYPVGDFIDKDYEDQLFLCKNIKGKFLLTINNDSFITHLFHDFKIINTDVFYNVSKNNSGRKKYPELIITNY